MPTAAPSGSRPWKRPWPWPNGCNWSWGSTPQGEQREFGGWLEQSRANFDALLWNGEYYKIDAESGTPVVMADQLCGDFYARLLGLPAVVADDRALSALQAVKEACFEGFQGGSSGVANGLRRDGTPLDPNGTHPLEVWTGINFGLAAYYRLMGDASTAFAITGAVVNQVYARRPAVPHPGSDHRREHLPGLPLPAGHGDLGPVGHPHRLAADPRGRAEALASQATA